MASLTVRIAVGIDPEGKWGAWGGHDVTDEDAITSACESLATGEARYWLIAELEIPTPKRLHVDCISVIDEWNKVEWSTTLPQAPGYYCAKDDDGKCLIVQVERRKGQLRCLGFGELDKMLWGKKVAPPPMEPTP